MKQVFTKTSLFLTFIISVSLYYNFKYFTELSSYKTIVNNITTRLWPNQKENDLLTLNKITEPVNKKDLHCMATNIYREAATQSIAGKMAVGQVVINRTKSPSYPSNICAVIYQYVTKNSRKICQFSWACVKKLPKIDYSSRAWKESLSVAENLLSLPPTLRLDITNGATHYHANSVNPQWKQERNKIASIDQHIFYKF